MRNLASRLTFALVLAAVVTSVSAQSAPSAKLIGTWKFNAQKSKMVNTPAPKEMTRTYEDRGNGPYAYAQVTIAADGTRTETRYVANDDGRENEMFRVAAGNTTTPTGNTIAFRWVDGFTANQTQTGSGFVVTAKRTISTDGRTMTITVDAEDDGNRTGGPPAPDVVVFDKQ